MIVDAHQHFWTLSRGDYAWPDETVPAIRRDFGPADLWRLADAAGVDRTVLVQATDSVAETTFLLDVAAREPRVAGVVGWIDMAAPDAVATFDRMRADPLLVGLRPMLQGIAETDWVLRDAVRPALDALEGSGLCFDALVQPRHLGAIDTLAARHPSLPIVLDHGAKPQPGGHASWAEGMRRLAGRPNVTCKLSGLVTEIGPDWTVEGLRPYADTLLEAFGPERVMFGSDWPVVNLAADYGAWFDAAQALTAHLDAGARAAIFGGTACRVYGIGGT